MVSYLFPTYSKKSLCIKEGRGAWLQTEDGKDYLDFMAGIAVCNLGHRHPKVVAALHQQVDRLWHASNLFHYDVQEEAARQLVQASACDYVFFTNSGTEAIEAAIKLARKATGKNHIVSMKQSFHGRTLGSMAATGQDGIKSGFGPMLQSFSYAQFNDMASLHEAVTDETAAIMVEIVQGEGGVHVMTASFAEAMVALCKEQNLLLIVDEIQTGMGRTGKLFAYEHYGLEPDIVTVAKGLGNGFPIGAMLGKASLKEAFGIGSHGSTFGGNPLAAATAIAVLAELSADGFLPEVEEKAERFVAYLKGELSGIAIVKDIRHKGFLIGIETAIPALDLIAACEQQGLLLLPAGSHVTRLLPPLTVSESEWRQAVAIIKQAATIYERENSFSS